MTQTRMNLSFLMLILIASSTAYGQITVDGTLDSNYGTPLATQTTNTHFGDMDVTLGAQGSEWNAAYAYQDNDRIYFMLTGNLEQNFNKLEIFFDTVAGGENVLSAIPEYDFGETSTFLGGLTFDTGFEADYHMYVRGGNIPEGDVFDVDFVDRAGGLNVGIKSNGGRAPYDPVLHTASGSFSSGDLTGAAGDALAAPINFAMDNNNTTGVNGIWDDFVVPADVLAATQGFEFSIRLADLGLDTTQANTFKVAVMQNGGNHDYLSNQILGGLPEATANLGGDGTGTFTGDVAGIDFNSFAGDQFFSVSVAAVTAVSLVCDADGDGDCQNDDIVAMYGQAGTAGSLDLDGSGVVDGADVDDWLVAASDPSNLGKISSSHVYKIGDVDLDGDVDSTDLGALLNNFSSTAGVGYAGGDLDMDMNVNSSDLGLLLNEFGHSSVSAAAVPEPGSLPIMFVALATLLLVRRKNG